MKYKKNKFIIFYVFNIFLLIVILLFAIPVSKFLNKRHLDDNEFVIGQKIISPKDALPKIIDRKIHIKFIAEVENSLQWNFKPLKETVNINVGENQIIRFQGKNLSDKVLTSTADFIAYPDSISPYLIKTECFCFTEQTLKPGENKIFTLVFYLDPSLDSDDNLDNLKELVFTYRFSEYKS